MFLSVLKKRNPALLRGAHVLLKEGAIPANTWLMDLDAVAQNAAHLARAKEEAGLQTYVMSKQFGRNPLINHLAMQKGLHASVCVDIQCVRAMGRWQIPVGHVGHLNQIPRGDMPYVLGLRPEVWTLYSLENARYLNDIAHSMGVRQDILIRVHRPGDVFFDGQEGGFPLENLPRVMPALLKLQNLRVVGVTSFPCYVCGDGTQVIKEPTPNLATIVHTAEILRRDYGLEITQINAPGNNSAVVFPWLKAHGATHVEPGHALSGTTANHLIMENLPEIPAYCYVTEVTHKHGGMAYAHGGGLYIDPVVSGGSYKAAVGGDEDSLLEQELEWKQITQIIDYHMLLEDGSRCEVGDTVVTCQRTQMHMTRSWVAVVRGLASGRPQLVGLFDNAGHMLDETTREVLPLQEAYARVIDVVRGCG